MSYKKTFNPENQDTGAATKPVRRKGDRRDGDVYIYDDKIVLAVNVSLATRRPLLVYGPPGSGKSTLAPYIAKCLKWRFYEQIVSSRTQASDLMWSFDSIRRLSDAQATRAVRESAAYIEPGVLWWAFLRESAMYRGLTAQRAAELKVESPVEPGLIKDRHPEFAVVLLDEIDKADPDVPNNLLVPLGSYRFRVEELELVIEARQPPLVVVTTNDERELPKAFLRRCVVLTLGAPDLPKVAESHFGTEGSQELYNRIAEQVNTISKAHREKRMPEPSTAEYLDAVSACIDLGITPDSTEWLNVSKATLSKRTG